ncbi:hypothetical protein ECC02_001284 [Trypanosoma cruzi]|uniref:Transmembrane protein n=1 Tax=Trypanosoma cruzi TaxID=5693 RepID=A0A7J6YGU6_TRYCR|nr:hypothetical protein ECC02_001284 [Trypanosoma cruzi]
MTSTSRKMQRCALHFIPCIWIGTLIQETLHHSGESTLRRVVQRRPSTSVRRIQVHSLHWLRGENGVNNANFSRKCCMVQERHPVRIALRDTTPMPHVFLHTCLVPQAAGIIDCFLPLVASLHGCVACRPLVRTHTKKKNKTNEDACACPRGSAQSAPLTSPSPPRRVCPKRNKQTNRQNGSQFFFFRLLPQFSSLLPLSSVCCFLSPTFCSLLISFPPLFRLFGAFISPLLLFFLRAIG